MLNDDTRGAVVEAVVSRMKTIQAAHVRNQRSVRDKNGITSPVWSVTLLLPNVAVSLPSTVQVRNVSIVQVRGNDTIWSWKLLYFASKLPPKLETPIFCLKTAPKTIFLAKKSYSPPIFLKRPGWQPVIVSKITYLCGTKITVTKCFTWQQSPLLYILNELFRLLLHMICKQPSSLTQTVKRCIVWMIWFIVQFISGHLWNKLSLISQSWPQIPDGTHLIFIPGLRGKRGLSLYADC